MENNKALKETARVANIPLWKIAAELSVCENTISRWLRNPLSEEKERRIIGAIEKLKMQMGDI